MLIAVDIGNARASFGAFEGKRLMKAWSGPIGLGRAGRPPRHPSRTIGPCAEGVVVSCVVKNAAPGLRAALRDAFGAAPRFVSVGDVPMRVAGYDERQLGVDRLLAALAAYERHRRALIVVDAGTAITVDYVNSRGEFAGGAIAPGLGLAAVALSSAAPRLPRLEPAPARRAIAKGTEEAMRAGLYLGYAGLVDSLVKRIAKESRSRPLVVATGGDARLIARACPSVKRVHPHLVLEGLRLTWERNC